MILGSILGIWRYNAFRVLGIDMDMNIDIVFSMMIHCISQMVSMRAEHFLYFNNSRI